jgi:hypothetical protein
MRHQIKMRFGCCTAAWKHTIDKQMSSNTFSHSTHRNRSLLSPAKDALAMDVILLNCKSLCSEE